MAICKTCVRCMQVKDFRDIAIDRGYPVCGGCHQGGSMSTPHIYTITGQYRDEHPEPDESIHIFEPLPYTDVWPDTNIDITHAIETVLEVMECDDLRAVHTLSDAMPGNFNFENAVSFRVMVLQEAGVEPRPLGIEVWLSSQSSLRQDLAQRVLDELRAVFAGDDVPAYIRHSWSGGGAS